MPLLSTYTCASIREFVAIITAAIVEQRLVNSTPAANAFFGYSISINSAGDVVAIGARGETVGGFANAGAAYILTRVGVTWTQQRLVSTTPAAAAFFGWSISINSAGDTVAIGARGETVSALANAGAAYIFTRSGVTWAQQQRLVSSTPAAAAQFGFSISINSAGDVVAIGANGETVSALANAGAAYIFTRSGVTWTQQQRLVSTTPAGATYFGRSISINSAGDAVAIGADSEIVSALVSAGAAYIFTRLGVTWTQQQRLVSTTPAANAIFGRSISINSAGDAVAIGATTEKVSALVNAGAAYIFTRSGVTWTQQQRLVSSTPAASAFFGISISINSAGDAVAIGAYNETVSALASAGAAYIFTRSGVTWTQQQRLVSSTPVVAAQFGVSVSINTVGDYVAIGAQGETVSGFANAGAAYICTT